MLLQQGAGTTALGGDGGDKGYAGIRNSLAIEFDTYENYAGMEDPNGNHISIHTRGSFPNSAHHRFSLACATNLPCKLNDGRAHCAEIVFEAATSELFVVLDSVLVIKTKLNIQERLQANSSTCWIGFTAGTGGLTQEHRILSFSLHNKL